MRLGRRVAARVFRRGAFDPVLRLVERRAAALVFVVRFGRRGRRVFFGFRVFATVPPRGV
jgi:hypothetical protein